MGLFSKNKTEDAIIETANAENDELLAVLTAAVAAYEEERFIQTLYIKKIDRTCGTRPIWGAIGTQEAIDVRRL